MADKSYARKARREQCSQVKVVFDAMIKVAQAFLLILLSFFCVSSVFFKLVDRFEDRVALATTVCCHVWPA